MDETFWKGTITESEILIPFKNIECIRQLVDRGIMNSISSKNDFDVVKSQLQKAGIWDLFIFPKIGWEDKGMQIQEIIKQCNLREENVLFIDDNFHNLEEAKFVCPKINVEQPDIIESLVENSFLEGNKDINHERLKQYKILEEKSEDKNKYESNEKFLYHSNIRVQIKDDCIEHCERLLDLINRSNQLNYTKIRLTMEKLVILLNNPNYSTKYISVKDKYGDYGIIGFVAIKENIAEHFLFSCRTIGLGVEQYVYAELGYPQINVVGEVITRLNSNEGKPSWINQEMQLRLSQTNIKEKGVNVLIRGGCDLAQLEQYLSGKINIKCEFNYLRYHRDHTVFACASYMNNKDILNIITKKVPFLYDNTFETEIFNEDNDIVIMSILMDYTQAVYSYNKNEKIKIAFGNFDNPISEENTCGYSIKELEWFIDNFTFRGRISNEDLMNNLLFIRKHIPEHVKLILINGAEIPHENKKEPERYKIHQEYNRIITDFVKNVENTEILDVRKIVKNRGDLTDNIRHYQRNIYFLMAEMLNNMIYDMTGETCKVSKVNRLFKLIHKFSNKITLNLYNKN